MSTHFQTITLDEIHALQAESAGGNSDDELDVAAANEVEVYVRVTVAGTTITFTVESSLDGTNFASSKAFSAITTTGTFAIALRRGVDPIGRKLRVSWTLTGSFTFEIIAGKRS